MKIKNILWEGFAALLILLILGLILFSVFKINKIHRLWNKNIQKEDIAEIYTNIQADGKDFRIDGFFIDSDEKWGFVLPVPVNEGDMTFYAVFSDKEVQEFKARIQDGIGKTRLLDQDITVALIYDDNADAAYIETNHENSFQYLTENKDNELRGHLYEIDKQSGEIVPHVLKKISGHGHDSWAADKKSFKINLNKDEPLFSIDGTGNYVLLCGYRNNSLLSYIVASDLAKELSFRFCHNYKIVDLYVDGNYQGLYFLTNRMESEKKAIDIQRPVDSKIYAKRKEIGNKGPEQEKNDKDIVTETYYSYQNQEADATGGFLFEFNSTDYSRNDCRFVTDYGFCISLKNDKYASKEQIDYCLTLWDDIEDAIYSENGYNPKGDYYLDFFDENTLADSWIMYDLAMESSLTSSIFLYKDSDLSGDGKLYSWSIWDCEDSFIYQKEKNTQPHLPIVDERRENHKFYYWNKLYEHQDFRNLVNKRWREAYLPVLKKLMSEEEIHSDDGISSLVWYRNEYATASQINGYKWPGTGIIDKSFEIDDLLRERVPFLTEYYAQNATKDY